MIAIGNYFVFIMSVIGTIIAALDITPENELICNYKNFTRITKLGITLDILWRYKCLLDGQVFFTYI